MNVNMLAVLLSSATLLISACSASSPQASGSITPAAGSGSATNATTATTRTSDGGQVTVVVDWAGLADGAAFDVRLDTHSVDLDALDFSNAVLRNDRGQALTARPWAASKGGHHREGALSFDGNAATFFAGANWIQLTLAGVGEIQERIFRWEIGP